MKETIISNGQANCSLAYAGIHSFCAQPDVREQTMQQGMLPYFCGWKIALSALKSMRYPRLMTLALHRRK